MYIVQHISEWALELPYWEQLALLKIIEKKEIEQADLEELVQCLLEEEGIENQAISKEMIDWSARLSKRKDNAKTFKLKEISNLENVNALVPNQRLEFNPNLTAIFGRNGAGKSGYARLLGAAGFTRGDKEVLPNIHNEMAEEAVVSADIIIDIDENGEEEFHYVVGEDNNVLNSLYVFDSTSVKVHVTGKNQFSFSPSGLSILTELSDLTDMVRTLLNQKIQKKRIVGDFEKYFSGESEIKSLISEINVDTNMTPIKDLAKLSDADEKKMHELNIQIGNIGLDKVNEEIAAEKAKLGKAESLHTWLEEAQNIFDNKSLASLADNIKEYKQSSEISKNLGISQFSNDKFSSVGSETWIKFAKITNELIELENQEKPYPQKGDVCLLCYQELSSDAINLLVNLRGYVVGEAQKKEAQLKAKLDKFAKRLNSDKFKLEDDYSETINLIDAIDPALAEELKKLIEICKNLGSQVLKNIEAPSGNLKFEGSVDSSIVLKLKILCESIAKKIDNLKTGNLEKQLESLEKQKVILEHRKKLSEIIVAVENHVKNLKWAREASKLGGSTRHITVKYNQLFDELVKNRYVQIFEENLKKLERKLEISISTSGKKGNTVKQFIINSHSTSKILAAPEKILSEGEKRAIAVADFLTEVTLDSNSCGIVLDDPVTSLDFQWRKAIADEIVAESNNRQVIVFTHDISFLYFLIESARENAIDYSSHWIRRGETDDLPGYVFLNNGPALEKNYKSSRLAKECYDEARKIEDPTKQLRILKEGFGALRTSYEALIIFEMFNGVIERFNERLSFGRLSGVVIDNDIVDTVIKSCERLSRYIEGHLHSDALDSTGELGLSDLNDEIQKFDQTRKGIRELKKI
jgi:ABC-type Mn2+/Zn2+ transport system ATPase subunit